MKRGTPFDPRVDMLAEELGCGFHAAVGILEMLFHFASRYAPRGDVGKWDNAEIAKGIRWAGDSEALIAALVAAGWLIPDLHHRLVVCDWSIYADYGARKTTWQRNEALIKRRGARSSPRVYFAQAVESKRIKIGISTRSDAHARIAELQSGCPERIEILCLIPCDAAMEWQLHERFREHHIHGEWFHGAKPLLDYVEEIKARRR